MPSFHRRSLWSIILVFSLLISSLLEPFATSAADGMSGINRNSLSTSLQQSLTTLEPSRMLQGNLSGIIRSDEDILSYFGVGNTQYGLTHSQAELRITRKDTDKQGKEHYLLQQHYRGLPVYGKYVRAHVGVDRKIYAVTNDSSPELNQLQLDVRQDVDASRAVALLQADIEREIGQTIMLGGKIGMREVEEPKAELMIFPQDDQYYLAYRIDLEYIDPGYGRWIGFVDANTGAVLKKFSNMMDAAPEGSMSTYSAGYYGKQRNINIIRDGDRSYLEDKTKPMYRKENGEEKGVIATYDYENPFYPVSSYNYSFDDPEAVDAHYFAGQVYDFYLNRFGLNSLDGKGMSIISVVNGGPIDNAYWNGYEVVYGDGARTFECLVCANDIVAHELTHAVTEFSANLEYVGQSGALNESLSDIMAAVFDDDDWLIGEDAGISAGSGALRDMQNPEKSLSPQPKHMADYVRLPEDASHDNGGIHTNSGIPNYAAYLIAEGIDALPGLQGRGRALLGQIAFGALTSYLTPTSGFIEARDAFVLAAEDLSLADDSERNSVVAVVIDAWATVGLPYESNENNIVSFSVAGMAGKAEIDTLAHTVRFNVEYGISLNGLMPNIAVSPGATISPGVEAKQDFSSPVTYIVTARNGTAQSWTVLGSVFAPETFKDIIGFNTEVQSAPAIIDAIQRRVTIYVESTDDVSLLQPSIELSKGATIFPASGETVNLNKPVDYTVTAQDGSTQKWTVTAIKDSLSPKLLGAVSVENRVVALVFDQEMSLSTLGDRGNYSLLSLIPGYSNPQVTKVEVDCYDPSIVYLTTSQLVSKNGYKVTVSNLKSSSGLEVRADWTTGYFLTDDTAAPVLNAARVQGKLLTLTFNEYVRGVYGAQNAFIVKINGTPVQVSSFESIGRTIKLTLARVVAADDVVKVSYRPSQQDGIVTDLSGNRLVLNEVTAINRSAILVPTVGENFFFVNGSVKQIIKHPTEPVVYSIFQDKNTVISANLKTGESITTTLDRQPERLFFAGGKLYVALVDQEHSSYWREENQTGSIAILDGTTLKKEKQFNVKTDPFDLAVDANGIIYVTSGSGQWTHVTSYSPSTGNEISYKTVRQASYVQISQSLMRLYTINTDAIPRDINAYNFNVSGQFTDEMHYGYDSPYHGDYWMTRLLRITPDERYLMNGAGTIFASTADKAGDMVYVRSIDPFDDIAFSKNGQTFYTLKDQILRQYDYATFKLEKQFALPPTAYAIFPGETSDQLLVAYLDKGGTTIMPYLLGGKASTISSQQSIAGNAISVSQLSACPVSPGPVSPGPGGGNPGGIPGGFPGGIPSIVSDEPGNSATTSMSSEDMTVSQTTDPQGELVTTVKPDRGKLLKAIEASQSGSEQSRKNGGEAEVPRVVLPLAELGKRVVVEMSADLFIEAVQASPKASIVVQTDKVSYEFPVQLFSPHNLMQVWRLNGEYSHLQINVTIEKVEQAVDEQIRKISSDEGFDSVSAPVRFVISLSEGGKTIEMDDFGKTYVTRSFVVPTTSSANKLTALLYDPLTKQTSFVPAFIRKENGQTIVDVKAPHNSIYFIASSTKSFQDITYHYARNDIEMMASKKVVLGVSSSSFNPNQTVTRAEFAALLVRSLGLALPESGQSAFSDVQSTAWHARTVIAASRAGLITGYTNGTFGPNGIITRQEMAVMIGRAIRFAGSEANQKFVLTSLKDALEIGNWAAVDVQHMLATGIMENGNGYKFEPLKPVTRADATVALKRMLQQLNFIN